MSRLTLNDTNLLHIWNKTLSQAELMNEWDKKLQHDSIQVRASICGGTKGRGRWCVQGLKPTGGKNVAYANRSAPPGLSPSRGQKATEEDINM